LILSDKKISGILLSSEGRTQKTLIATMPVFEVAAFFSVGNLLPELKWAADAAVNAKNADKVQEIQAELESILFDKSVCMPLSLTFAVIGKPHLHHAARSLPTLSYNPSDTHIVGNVLVLVAICKILGLKTFLFSSRFFIITKTNKL
jgi:hypothetical protein